jgi:hypothetical protein
MPRASLAESSIPLSKEDRGRGQLGRLHSGARELKMIGSNVPLGLLLVARKGVTGLLGERLVVGRLGAGGSVVGLSLDHVDSLLEVLRERLQEEAESVDLLNETRRSGCESTYRLLGIGLQGGTSLVTERLTLKAKKDKEGQRRR